MKCKNHPARDAPYACKRCSADLCGQCRMIVHEGTFCSQECIDEFREFQSRIWTKGGPRRRITIRGLVRYTVIVSVLIAVIAGALYVWLGTTDPGQMWETIHTQYRAAF